MLRPSRTESNIRFYDLANLQKLLNVALLYQYGVKISKIAGMNDDQLRQRVRSHIHTGADHANHLGALKIAMLNFDRNLFDTTYNRMTSEMSFKEIFLDVFIPLLNNIGLEWQSNSITPAHEHFISNLVKQKLHINIERVQQTEGIHPDHAYVLFLPLNEIHEFGLLYIHYELLLRGNRSIYLGQSVPMENLSAFKSMYKRISFISYFTVQPAVEDLPAYLKEFKETLLDSPHSLAVLGRNATGLVGQALPNQIVFYPSLPILFNDL